MRASSAEDSSDQAISIFFSPFSSIHILATVLPLWDFLLPRFTTCMCLRFSPASAGNTESIKHNISASLPIQQINFCKNTFFRCPFQIYARQKDLLLLQLQRETPCKCGKGSGKRSENEIFQCFITILRKNSLTLQRCNGLMQVKLKTFTLEDLVQVPLLKYLAEGTPGRISIICTNLISITPGHLQAP